MKCKNFIFQAWKVMEFYYQSQKSWKIKVVFGRLVMGHCKTYISN